jgi:hypothetical protein
VGKTTSMSRAQRTDSTLGIYGQVVTVAGVGQVDRVTIARNRVTNATGHGIDMLRSLG